MEDDLSTSGNRGTTAEGEAAIVDFKFSKSTGGVLSHVTADALCSCSNSTFFTEESPSECSQSTIIKKNDLEYVRKVSHKPVTY